MTRGYIQPVPESLLDDPEALAALIEHVARAELGVDPSRVRAEVRREMFPRTYQRRVPGWRGWLLRRTETVTAEPGVAVGVEVLP